MPRTRGHETLEVPREKEAMMSPAHRSLLLIVAGLLALAPAAAAQTPPGVGGPADGAGFTQGDPITFTAYDDTTTSINPHVYVHISKSSTPEPYTGVIADEVWFGELSGGPNWTRTWTGSGTVAPGTYYWQIYRTDDTPCFYIADCYIEAGVRSFTIGAAPPPPAGAPTLVSPAPGETVYRGSAITFTATDSSAGANLTIHISTSGVKDSTGVIAHDVWETSMSGGPSFTAQWYQPATQALGTYYWQAYRNDAGDADGRVESAVRSFTLAEPAAGPPTLLSPANGAAFAAGQTVTFVARGATGQSMWVRVSKTPTPGIDGVIGTDMGIDSMSGGPDFSTAWHRSDTAGPGTYYWQVYRIDCFTPSYPDCKIESGVRSFKLVEAGPGAPPLSLAPAAGAVFRAGAEWVTFRVSDEAGADIRVLISRSTAKDSDGLLRSTVGGGTLRLSGGPVYTKRWENDLVQTGTLYWQPYRDECDFGETGDCLIPGPVRRFVIRPSLARIAVADRCYREQRRIPVAGRGFRPRRLVDIRFLGQRRVTRRTGSRGRFSARVPAPNLASYPHSERDRLYAYERNNDANEPSVRVRITAIAVSVSRTFGIRRGQKIGYRFSGFPNGHSLYAHYLRGGRVRGTVRLGRTRAPCGTLRTRAELIPSRIERAGTWTVQFDARRAYSKGTRPRIRKRITVSAIPIGL